MATKTIYLIGSLRNPQIPIVGKKLREIGFNVFDAWFAAGPEADDYWRDYEKQLGHSYQEALQGHPAKHVFTFDQFHLNKAHAAVLVYPAGKSGHLELGYVVGQGKPGFILLDEVPDRYDVMKQFATGGMTNNIDDLMLSLLDWPWPKVPEIPDVYQHDAMWLAGLLEGEGSFSISKATPRLVLQMTDKDVVTRAASILNSSVWTAGRLTKGGKPVYCCGASGLTGVEWMRILKPYLGIRRNKQIVDVVSRWLNTKKYRQQDNVFWATVFGL